MDYRRNMYGFLTTKPVETQTYWVWIYKGKIVSPLLTGGYNAVCRWIWSERPDIAAEAFLFKMQNCPDDFNPLDNSEYLPPGWGFND